MTAPNTQTPVVAAIATITALAALSADDQAVTAGDATQKQLVTQLQTQLSQIEAEKAADDAQIATLTQELTTANAQIAALIAAEAAEDSAPPPPPPPPTIGMPASLAATIALVEPPGSRIQKPGLPLTVAPATTFNGQWTDSGVTYQNFSPDTESATGEWAQHISRCPDGSGLRLAYGPTLAGGNSPVRFGTSIPNVGTGYGCFAIRKRLSSGWTLSKAAELKLFEPRSAGAENHVVVANCYGQPTDGTNMWLGMLLQFANNAGNRYVPGNSKPTSTMSQGGGWADSISYFLTALANLAGSKRGQWQDIAVGLYPEPIAGQPGARIKLAVDQTLVYDSALPGALGVPPGGLHLFETVMGWKYLMFDPCYGGDVSSDHPPTEEYYDVDCIYSSTA
jgi:hypothetical protein